MNQSHTPTPWHIGSQLDHIHAQGGELILTVSGDGPSLPTDNVDALYIVHCVNSHDALVKALRQADCPHSARGRPDPDTVGGCVDSGNCGCVLGEPLVKR